MFICTQMGGQDLAFPDTCDTPLAAGAPIPIPYPNQSTDMTSLPCCATVFMAGMPAHTLITQDTISNGDEAGCELGLASLLIMGPGRKLLGSLTVFLECMPATKMTNPTGQNGLSLNALGANLVPSQFTTMALT